MLAQWLDAKLMARGAVGAGGLVSPLRVIGADGWIGGSGTAKGVPVSQSHNERLSGRRARPSHEGGALDQIAQPPSCIPITHIIESRYHILRMPLISRRPDAGDVVFSSRRQLPPAIGCAACCRLGDWPSPPRGHGWPPRVHPRRRRRRLPWHWRSAG